MKASETIGRTGLDKTTSTLLVLSLVLAVLHHTDHVLRVDHSGWPFRKAVTPFTFSLLAYPMILFALFGSRKWFWWRWGLLAIGTASTVLAHTILESPQMQYGMWADNRSIDPHGAGLHNLLDVRSPATGVIAVLIGMGLNMTAVAATFVMFARGLRLRRDVKVR